MLDCIQVARFFVLKACENGCEQQMTNTKVQQLLYYTQSLHLALFDEPLFECEIQAWRCGPVCPPAYPFYSSLEAEQLPMPDRSFLSEISDEVKELLEEVWDYFGHHPVGYLSEATYEELPSPEARSAEPIQLEDMKLLGDRMLEQIERDNPVYRASLAYLLEQSFTQSNKAPEYLQEEAIDDWLASLQAS